MKQIFFFLLLAVSIVIQAPDAELAAHEPRRVVAKRYMSRKKRRRIRRAKEKAALQKTSRELQPQSTALRPQEQLRTYTASYRFIPLIPPTGDSYSSSSCDDDLF